MGDELYVKPTETRLGREIRWNFTLYGPLELYLIYRAMGSRKERPKTRIELGGTLEAELNEILNRA